jgi:hypothetical protein
MPGRDAYLEGLLTRLGTLIDLVGMLEGVSTDEY